MANIDNSQHINITGSNHVSLGDVSNKVLFSDKSIQRRRFEDANEFWDALLSIPDLGVALVRLIEGLREELQREDRVEEEKIQGWLDGILELAPDVWEVIVDTLSSPLRGVSTVVQKVLIKARQAHKR